MIARLGRWLAGPIVRRVQARRDLRALAVVLAAFYPVRAVSVADRLGWPVERAAASLERLYASRRVACSVVQGVRRYGKRGGR